MPGAPAPASAAGELDADTGPSSGDHWRPGQALTRGTHDITRLSHAAVEPAWKNLPATRQSSHTQAINDARPIRVLCVDDNPDVLSTIRLMIDAERQPLGGMDRAMECVGCLASADELIDEVHRLGPDIVLLDATMRGKDAFEAVRELRRAAPDTHAVIFSGYDDPAFNDRALEAGAWGCLSKHDPPKTILQAVRDVAAGEVYFC